MQLSYYFVQIFSILLVPLENLSLPNYTYINKYINKCNWKGIDFPAGPREWKKLEQNNKTIALNILLIRISKLKPYINKALILIFFVGLFQYFDNLMHHLKYFESRYHH